MRVRWKTAVAVAKEPLEGMPLLKDRARFELKLKLSKWRELKDRQVRIISENLKTPSTWKPFRSIQGQRISR